MKHLYKITLFACLTERVLRNNCLTSEEDVYIKGKVRTSVFARGLRFWNKAVVFINGVAMQRDEYFQYHPDVRTFNVFEKILLEQLHIENSFMR